jgi:tetratricopeptide (TPR) repeat protein
MFAFFRRRKANRLIEEARAALRDKRIDDAVAGLEAALVLGTEEDGEASLLLAVVERDRGNRDAALRRFAEARAKSPDSGAIAIDHAVLLQEAGDLAAAVRAFDDARACKDRHVFIERRAVRGAALCAARLGKKDAEKRLADAVDEIPIDDEAHAALARVRAQRGNKTGAIAALRIVLRGSRDDVEAYERLLALQGDPGAEVLRDAWRPASLRTNEGEAALVRIFDGLRFGGYAEALQEARSLLEGSVERPVDRALLAFVLARADKLAEARPLVADTGEHAPFYRFVRALVAVHEAREEEAWIDLERLHTERLSFPALAYLVGGRRYVRGDHEGAAAAFREVLAADPEDAEVMLQLAEAVRDANEHDEARALERKAYRTNPVLLHADATARTGVLQSRQAAARRARAEARVAESPDDPRANLDLARARLATGDPKGAWEAAKAVPKGAPEYAEAWFVRGYASFVLQDFESAVRQLERAAKLRPEHAETRAYLGQALAQSGKPKEAMPHLDEAIRLDPYAYYAHSTKGVILSMEGRPAEAEVHHRAATRADPRRGEPHLNLGIDLAKQRDFALAERELRFAAILMPNDPQVHHRHADVLATLGQRERAAAAGARAQALMERGLVRQALQTDLPWPAVRHGSPWGREERRTLEELAREVCAE